MMNANKDFMLTTEDNPYDYFKEYDQWKSFDQQNNYYTEEYIARIAKLSDNLSEIDEIIEINNAINEILELNITGNYKLVYDT